MIGGLDIPLDGPARADDLDVLLRAARAVWPNAVVEDGAGTFVVPIGQALRRMRNLPSEFFLYENHAAYESWTASGLTEENGDKMVSVTVEADCISFVVSESSAPTARLVDEMIDAVKENRWGLALDVPAAA